MRKKIVSKEAIIVMAEELIKTEGLGKCSMRRIAKELGIAAGTVYNYFETREELLRHVFMHSWEKTIKDANSVADREQDIIQGLKEIVELLRRDIHNRNGLGRELMNHSSSFQISGKEYIRKNIIRILTKMLKRNGIEMNVDKLAKWIFLIVLDTAINNEMMDETDWIRLERLIR